MANIKNPVQLYRHLLRCMRQLPKDAQIYYKNYIRQGYNSHSDETDPKRIQQIIDRAAEDIQYIVKKYKK